MRSYYLLPLKSSHPKVFIQEAALVHANGFHSTSADALPRKASSTPPSVCASTLCADSLSAVARSFSSACEKIQTQEEGFERCRAKRETAGSPTQSHLKSEGPFHKRRIRPCYRYRCREGTGFDRCLRSEHTVSNKLGNFIDADAGSAPNYFL